MPKKLTISDAAIRVRELMGAMDLTQQQFASTLGVSVTQVSRWVNGRAVPNPMCQQAVFKLEKEFMVGYGDWAMEAQRDREETTP